MDRLPGTYAEIRATLNRDRREDDRRHGATDDRIFQYERRTGDRRANDHQDHGDATQAQAGTSATEIVDELQIIAESLAPQARDVSDLTCIRDMSGLLTP